jgi:hypothetical protein
LEIGKLGKAMNVSRGDRVKKFKTKDQLVKAFESGEIPKKVLSPGGVATVLGISRQAVYQRIRRGTLNAWTAEGIILVDPRTFWERLRDLGASNDEGGGEQPRRKRRG